jgi:gamma-glutamyltranspeptidase / glutathione hydrolase
MGFQETRSMTLKIRFANFFSIAALSLLCACSHGPRACPDECEGFAQPAPAAPPQTALPVPVTLPPADREAHEASGKEFVVAAEGVEASKAALAIHKLGGNIIDSAVAASFVLAVERPQSTGLGGGGFVMFREAKTKKIYAVDFRERAPLAAEREMYLDSHGEVVPNKSLNGILAAAVPGMVAGLIEIHDRFGHLPLQKVLAPAIAAAEKGITVTPQLSHEIEFRKEVLAHDPAARAIFLKADGSPWVAGETLVQKDLARSLRLIAKQGRRAFYRGEIASALLDASKRQGGIITRADLNAYTVKWRNPLMASFRGYNLYTMPPPSSGGMHVFEVLNILEQEKFESIAPLSPEIIHRTAASLQMAFADRARYGGDPDFVQVPASGLISKAYAYELRNKIVTDKARPSEEVLPGDPHGKEEHLETTHISLMDREGNTVASTQTINYVFGSGVVVPGTGILLNDEMDDFSAKPGAANVFGAIGGEANAIAPQKTPLSSMTPTIVLKDGSPVLALGTRGGTRIISCVAETLLNRLGFGLSPYDSVAAARFHHQWRPDLLEVELPGVPETTVRELEQMGYHTRPINTPIPCAIQLTAKDKDGLKAVTDPRSTGLASGM